MELVKAIEERRSIRKFSTRPVSDEQISQLLEAARLAPSGSNTQPWRFVILKSQEIREKLGSATPYTFAVKAPVVLACCADFSAMDTRPGRIQELVESGAFNDVEMGSREGYDAEKTKDEVKGYLSLNVAIAIEHIVLRAVDLGLGTCWIGGFNQDRVRDIIGLADNLHIVMLLSVGYPDQFPPQRPRIPIDQLVIKTL